MILVDTSVWVGHLRAADRGLVDLLNAGEAATHAFVIGELACGNLQPRDPVLSLLRSLPQAPIASAAEVLHFIETWRLMGRGIGYLDAHLLASAMLAETARIWTHDKRLAKVAGEIGLAFAA